MNTRTIRFGSRRAPRLRWTSVLAVGVLAVQPAHAVLIDDFSTAQGLLTATAPGITVDTVSGGGIIGGERTTLVAPTNFAPVPTIVFEAASGLMQAGADASIQGGQVGLTYGGPLSSPPLGYDLAADFTDGGASDRFLFEVSGVSGNVAYIINVHDSFTNFRQTPGLPEISAAGIVEVPFSDLSTISGAGATFSNVGALQIFFIFDANESITIASMCTGSAGRANCAPVGAPAPESVALVGIGLLAWPLLAGRRRRRCARAVDCDRALMFPGKSFRTLFVPGTGAAPR